MAYSKEFIKLMSHASNRCYSAGCTDEEVDRLLDMLFLVYETLELESAKKFARKITNINPAYVLSTKKKILLRQIEEL